MTDPVELARQWVHHQQTNNPRPSYELLEQIGDAMADAIEAQAKEIEWLRAMLRYGHEWIDDDLDGLVTDND